MKVAKYSNILIRSIFVFIITWLWISYYVRNFAVIVVISLASALIVNYIFFMLGQKKSIKAGKTKSNQEHKAKVILQLKFMTKAQVLSLFAKAINLPCTATKNKLVIKSGEKRVELFSLFHKEPVIADIIECVRLSKNTKILISAEAFPPLLEAFACSLKTEVKLINADITYDQILAPANVFPEIKIETKTQRGTTLATLKNTIFAREKIKTYLITALIIFATSFFIRFSIYYIVVATIVLALAASSYFKVSVVKNLFEN